MEFVDLPARQVPVYARTDLIIVGGGVAGISAAVAAVREGCRTILIEDSGILGGVVTKCPMPSFGSLNFSIIKGIFAEVCEKLKKSGALVQIEGRSSPFDPEAFKAAVFDMVEKERIELLLHTTVFDLMRDKNKRIEGVFIKNVSGIQAIAGKVVIDASGDGDIAAMAGEAWDESGQRQPMSLMFTVGNADVRRFAAFVRDYPDKNEFTSMGSPLTFEVEKIDEDRPQVNAWGFFNLIKKARERGELYLPHDNLAVIFLPVRGLVLVNATNVSGLSPLDAKDVSLAEVESRKQMLSVHNFLKKNIAGFEESSIVNSGYGIGVRESRRLIGEYVLTKDDVLTGRSFPDAVALNGGRISVHESGEKQTWIKLERPYQIPYRCLQARVNDNLLIAGRCISTDHIAQASIRNVSCCFATGQAAGTAAALAIAGKVKLKELDVKLLREALVRQGVVVG